MTIISMIIESYSTILLAIGAVSTLIFMLGIYLIILFSRVSKLEQQDSTSFAAASPRKYKRSEKIILSDALSDVSAISGENPVATQLDLAKAYIESGKGPLARIILAAVIRDGSSDYQEEAQRLLSSI
jgi:FimV-like protein